MNLTDPIFTNEAKAREHLEATRWPQGPECPHCGVVDQATQLHGKAHRPGVYECRACNSQFTATVGTVFERSKVPLNKWMLASYLMASSKKGVSAHQLHRTLGVTYKTAWFMAHRLREGMTEAFHLAAVYDLAVARPLAFLRVQCPRLADYAPRLAEFCKARQGSVREGAMV